MPITPIITFKAGQCEIDVSHGVRCRLLEDDTNYYPTTDLVEAVQCQAAAGAWLYLSVFRRWFVEPLSETRLIKN